jgi:hypothetical protein
MLRMLIRHQAKAPRMGKAALSALMTLLRVRLATARMVQLTQLCARRPEEREREAAFTPS